MIGDLTNDPAGAAARQEWISGLGLWYDEPDHLADRDSAIGPLATQTEAANPPGLADNFISWVRKG